MSSFSLPGLHRKEHKRHGWWRWAVLFSAGVFAVMWRTQTAISALPRRATSTLDTLANGARSRFNILASGEAAVLDRPDTGDVVGAGEDSRGTFRPTRVEPDEFGVVVTDESPAGLEGSDRWIKGDGSTVCPQDHPIKGNASSRIYHLPGEPSYERTIPELCFANEEDAQAAGFRPRSK